MARWERCLQNVWRPQRVVLGLTSSTSESSEAPPSSPHAGSINDHDPTTTNTLNDYIPITRRMPFTARHAAIASGVIIAAGTAYSLAYSTFLDTSNPLITGLPHPLHGKHYFASKQNPLNVLFLKRLWFWTSISFAALFFTSPPQAQTYERMYKYLTETFVWASFTSWFFGPALLERVITLTGGECSVTLPSGYVLRLPAEYCYPGGPQHISPATHPTLFAASLLVPETEQWKARPRLRKGHDVSGHIFLLTMSCLFLVDQLVQSRRTLGTTNALHKYATYAVTAVVAVELFSMYVTSVYFHSPSEKFTGYCKYLPYSKVRCNIDYDLVIGLAGYMIIKLPFFRTSTPIETVPEAKAEIEDTSNAVRKSIDARTR
jgi:hypothetical protein